MASEGLYSFKAKGGIDILKIPFVLFSLVFYIFIGLCLLFIVLDWDRIRV